MHLPNWTGLVRETQAEKEKGEKEKKGKDKRHPQIEEGQGATVRGNECVYNE